MIELETQIEIISGENKIQDAYITNNDYEEYRNILNAIENDEGNIFDGSKYFSSNYNSNEYGFFSTPYIIQLWTGQDKDLSLFMQFGNYSDGFPPKISVLDGSRQEYNSFRQEALYRPNNTININGNPYYNYIVSQAFANYEYIAFAQNYGIYLESGVEIGYEYARFVQRKINNTTKTVSVEFYVPASYAGAKLFVDMEVIAYGLSKTINNNSPIAKIDNAISDGSSIWLSFDRWTQPNSSIKITSVGNGIYYNIDNNKQQSLDFDVEERENTNLPSFGVVSNDGKISFTDNTGNIEVYARLGFLKEGRKITTKLKNTLLGSSEVIEGAYTKKWNYDSQTKQCNVTTYDRLILWQDIQVPSINYDARYPQSQNCKWYYEYLYKYTPQWANMLSFDELDTATKTILQETIVPYPYLESGNLFEQWNKLCALCQLHIFSNKQGKTICKYNGGN